MHQQLLKTAFRHEKKHEMPISSGNICSLCGSVYWYLLVSPALFYLDELEPELEEPFYESDDDVPGKWGVFLPFFTFMYVEAKIHSR